MRRDWLSRSYVAEPVEVTLLFVVTKTTLGDLVGHHLKDVLHWSRGMTKVCVASMQVRCCTSSTCRLSLHHGLWTPNDRAILHHASPGGGGSVVLYLTMSTTELCASRLKMVDKDILILARRCLRKGEVAEYVCTKSLSYSIAK